MRNKNMLTYIEKVLENMPEDWLKLTTHRLDIYNEKLAKTEFLKAFENLYNDRNCKTRSLAELPTAYDYIRLGHPLSCVLEWTIAKLHAIPPENVISFSSKTMPVMAVLRKNALEGTHTRILYTGDLPQCFNINLLQQVYGYSFTLQKLESLTSISAYNGSTILISAQDTIADQVLSPKIDFYVHTYDRLGSILLVNGTENDTYIPEIQHVRRRETIAMTPANCFTALKSLVGNRFLNTGENDSDKNEAMVLDAIKTITGTVSKPLVGSSGLSVQYAIMMGLVDHALENHKEKDIKFIVPPNCYGGTNDQARRVAACIENVAVVDLPVDGDNDMVQSLHMVLDQVAKENAVPYIIAEIPTNPRVEVPDLKQLKKALQQERKTATGAVAVDPVFILDQTFCPNVLFLGEGQILSRVRAISYASGSKFPSGGKCTAGYCVGNKNADALMKKIEVHLQGCNNEATGLQMEILAEQLPSMNRRIKAAYENTREFVSFIEQTLPKAKINFVSELLAAQGFTPSVFSLDLPTKGKTDQEREAYKRKLNHRLIDMMITQIPEESKHCVSYGQLKGCYWTIPATSTQGTTKEGDKDYIARVSLSPNLDLERHKHVFLKFVATL
ncbi:cystathionine beta-synthase [Maribacter chungangensis]|uniref:Cystathionine beta-synthase n=1 Tax=Maribacter chungangensis TaxID=1069117 RepID=A0ABW3B4J7_9FLAO